MTKILPKHFRVNDSLEADHESGFHEKYPHPDCSLCQAVEKTKSNGPAHLRIGVVKAGRRINDQRGNPGHTVCGAALTDKDIVPSDLRRLKAGDAAKYDLCRTCLATEMNRLRQVARDCTAQGRHDLATDAANKEWAIKKILMGGAR